MQFTRINPLKDNVFRSSRGGSPLFPSDQVLQVILLMLLMTSGSLSSFAQVSTGSPQPAAQPSPLPITIQIKKTIVFLETDCWHDFNLDLDRLTKDKVQQMPVAQQQGIFNQLTMVTLRLRGVKSSFDKLSAEDAARLFPNNPVVNPNPNDLPDEIEWKIRALVKMTTLTDRDIAGLKPKELAMIPVDQYLGTSFFVGYFDTRLKPHPGDAGRPYFRYLVTNRHVIEPGIENGRPCKVASSSILLNHKPDTEHTGTYAEPRRTDKILKWTTPQDDSVDLAVAAIALNENQYDHIMIPSDQFVTEEDIKNRRIVEGDPVLFSGLFIQTFNQVHTLEPIVRSGTLAMIPEGTLETTLNKKLGHIYLAEAHVFGGNSGSPVFVDPDKYAGVIRNSVAYKLLGVISGEVFEKSDLTLSVTTSLSGNLAANSDVSVVVPGPELIKLLDDTGLKAERERQIEAY